MPRYRKIVKEIEAVQLCWKNWNAVCDLLGDALIKENPDGAKTVGIFSDDCGEQGPEYITLDIRTINDQVVTVRHGDWIVPDGLPGRFYPIDPGVFRDSYEVIT